MDWAIKTVTESPEASSALKHLATYFKAAKHCQEYYGALEKERQESNSASSSATSSHNPDPPEMDAVLKARWQAKLEEAFQKGMQAQASQGSQKGTKKKAETWDISSDISDMSDVP